MKKELLMYSILMLCYSITSAQGIKITSSQDGPWHIPSTWDANRVPTYADTVIIRSGDSVSAYGPDKLAYSPNADYNDSCFYFKIENGGVLYIDQYCSVVTKSTNIVQGTLRMTGGIFNSGSTKGDILKINFGGTLLFSGGTINVAGRYRQYKTGYAYFSNDASLNIMTAGVPNNGFNNFYVAGNAKNPSVFDVASGSTVKISIKNGNEKSSTKVVHYSPYVSNFNGGSLIIENGGSQTRIRVESDMPIFKIESDIGDNDSLVFIDKCNFELNNLLLTSGISVVDSGARLTIDTASIGADNHLILEPDASVIFTNPPSHKVSVKRKIAAWTDAFHGWHFLSSPVASQAIRPEFVPNTPTTSEDFYKWDEPTHQWINTKSADGSWNTGFENSFVQGRGYLIAYGSDETKTFSGDVTPNDLTITGLTKTSGSPTEGWNLIGNPFTSHLTWNIGSWTKTNIDNTAKIWNESTASYTDIADGTGIIPPLQGVMVHVNSASGGSLTIDSADRVLKKNKPWYKSDSLTPNQIRLTIYDTDNNTAQESMIRVDEDATTSFDTKYDAYFLAGYAPQFYAVSGEDRLSTIALPELTAESDILYGFRKNSSLHFYLQAEGLETLSPAENVYLTDLLTSHTQLLNENPTYEFTAVENDPEIRFKLHFAPLGMGENIEVKPFNIFNVGNRVEVRSNHTVNAQVKVYNITGQPVKTAVMNNQTSLSVDVNQPQGVYIVSVVSNGKVQNQKIVIN